MAVRFQREFTLDANSVRIDSAEPERARRASSRVAARERRRGKRTGPPDRADRTAPEENLGGALLSRGRLPQYPRHWGPSLPCSEWERVLPPRHGHQGKETEDEEGTIEPVEWLRSEEGEKKHKPHGRLVPVG